MRPIEKIKAEIERRKEIHFKDYHINKNGNSADYGACNALTQLLSFIDSLEEYPVSNDLEEAATSYARKQLSNPDYPTYNDEYEMECAFEAGAQWQKEQDQSTIELAEDHAMLAGMEKMNQEMMENVVLETKVMKDSDGDGIDTPYEEWLTLEDTEIPFIPDNIGLKDGDKVKILIIKQ